MNVPTMMLIVRTLIGVGCAIGVIYGNRDSKIAWSMAVWGWTLLIIEALIAACEEMGL